MKAVLGLLLLLGALVGGVVAPEARACGTNNCTKQP